MKKISNPYHRDPPFSSIGTKSPDYNTFSVWKYVRTHKKSLSVYFISLYSGVAMSLLSMYLNIKCTVLYDARYTLRKGGGGGAKSRDKQACTRVYTHHNRHIRTHKKSGYFEWERTYTYMRRKCTLTRMPTFLLILYTTYDGLIQTPITTIAV